jgi:hypothetical protein
MVVDEAASPFCEEVEMAVWTVRYAVDVCLRALAEHLLKAVGHCPPLAELTGPDGTVVSLASVRERMARSFDDTIRREAPEVIQPLEVHKRSDALLAGTRDSGCLGVLLAPFTFRPGLWSLASYLRAELRRRAKAFAAKGSQIEVDLHAPLEVQADRYGQKIAYLVLSDLTDRHRWAAVAPLVSWR